MQYSYLLSVPLIMTYAIGFAVIKYSEGFVFIPGHGGKDCVIDRNLFLLKYVTIVVPKPYQMWGASAQSAIFPLFFLFSVAWSLEM